MRTSDATTAKPRPDSPARAASMAALSASRLVCAAMLRTSAAMACNSSVSLAKLRILISKASLPSITWVRDITTGCNSRSHRASKPMVLAESLALPLCPPEPPMPARSNCCKTVAKLVVSCTTAPSVWVLTRSTWCCQAGKTSRISSTTSCAARFDKSLACSWACAVRALAADTCATNPPAMAKTSTVTPPVDTHCTQFEPLKSGSAATKDMKSAAKNQIHIGDIWRGGTSLFGAVLRFIPKFFR